MIKAILRSWILTSLSFCNRAHLMTKSTKWPLRPANTQINLGIRPVWSESSMSAWGNLGSLATHYAHSDDWSDWADAQADLSLRLAHRLFCWFCHEAAQICGWLVCWFFSFNCRVVTVKVPHTSLLWHIPPLCYPNSFSPLSFFLETTRVLTSVKAAPFMPRPVHALYLTVNSGPLLFKPHGKDSLKWNDGNGLYV